MGVLDGPSEKEVEEQVKEYQLTLFDISLAKYPYAIVMSYGERSMRDVFLSERLSIKKTVAMFRQVAEALEYLHSKGWSHGDLKMLNVVRIGTAFRLIGNVYIQLYRWCLYIIP